ncbi:MAG: hypothetical protein BWX80_02229 [Candidatus Hydrogenedentes bacterium ADurb.Bin101]|nr:MAG: hypothetical protein BWX80_02229 [Candidatus Hydrogenedentes bacterium ADurb.Bin101]
MVAKRNTVHNLKQPEENVTYEIDFALGNMERPFPLPFLFPCPRGFRLCVDSG